jgi:acetyl esterase/lipase
MKLAIAFLLLAAHGAAAEMQVRRDLAYTEPRDERRTLDVYAPVTGKQHPVVVWIHGGGWRQGDKAGVQRKPQAFVDRGYAFVSVNYRFVPQVTVKEMTGDIAKAIKWVHDHAGEFGASAEKIVVAGHSAGAHLAALVSTDGRYLQAEGLPLSTIQGCIPVDTAAYDVPKRVQGVGALPASAAAVFGNDPATHKDLSPITFAAKDKQIPAFLILHVADRADSKAQSQAFAQALRDAGVSAKVVAGEGKTHGTINTDLGKPDDPPTKAVFEFLSSTLNGQRQAP